jgi:hypothetical protein
MADVTINDTELTFDLDAISISEYRAFAKGGLVDEKDDEVLAKVTGHPVEFFRELSQLKYRHVLRAFFRKASEPLADPN